MVLDKPTLAILLTLVVHLAGIGVLLWMAMSGDGSSWRDWWPRDDDGRGGDDPGPEPTAPAGGLPLPDASPSPVRLRTEHDAVRRAPLRRPAHAPGRERERV